MKIDVGFWVSVKSLTPPIHSDADSATFERSLLGCAFPFFFWCHFSWAKTTAPVDQTTFSGSKGGGLRLGEMEVSGLVGHAASETLQDIRWSTCSPSFIEKKR